MKKNPREPQQPGDIDTDALESQMLATQEELRRLRGHRDRASAQKTKKLSEWHSIQSKQEHKPRSVKLQKMLHDIQIELAASKKHEKFLNERITALETDYETAERTKNRVFAVTNHMRSRVDRYSALRSTLKMSVKDKSAKDKSYDVFISYASEDKLTVARPLAANLVALGLRVWFDEFELHVGDSLRRSIDQGLIQSHFGVVIFSKNFFSKQWPQYELDALTAREIEERKVILPIWHDISKKQILQFSPRLADKHALSTGQYSIDDICLLLFEAIEEQQNREE